MVAVVVKFVMGENSRWEAERIADIFTALLKQQGWPFHHVDYLGEYELGEYMGIVYWKTRDAAEESIRTFLPLLKEMVHYNSQYPITLELFDVYIPKEIDVDIDIRRV
ncbi:hypothetical protein [Alicyclobacillus fodiniaquatilis]|jgi:hypothetical protein|uniref:ABM domain-containing protein n=1 Tax=Alicyclobacillus fodiniaquatilis TaxID=1661150 RepID=A0ABW4JEE0_9BACL